MHDTMDQATCSCEECAEFRRASAMHTTTDPETCACAKCTTARRVRCEVIADLAQHEVYIRSELNKLVRVVAIYTNPCAANAHLRCHTEHGVIAAGERLVFVAAQADDGFKFPTAKRDAGPTDAQLRALGHSNPLPTDPELRALLATQKLKGR